MLIGVVIAVAGCAQGSSTTAAEPDSDRSAPVISITSPSSTGSFITNQDSVIVSGTATDNVAVDRITWSFNGSGEADVAGIDNWSTPVLLLSSGDNTISIRGTDAAGNQATTQIVVTYDPVTNTVLNGIGILGDSNSDEYRADDDRGGGYAAVTFNWVELLAMHRGLNFGAWGTRPSPRRTGFEYNWALSGATTASMLTSGQHTGLAQQVAAGDVTLVFVFIGFNDFAREKYAEIYDGTLSGAALDAKIAGVIDDITTAVDVLQAAGPVDIAVAELWDYSLELPMHIQAFPDRTKRQVATSAIREVNAGLRTMAQSRGIATFDISAATAEIWGRVDANGFLDLGGELIDTVNPGNEPHHLNLDDGTHHGGTVSNGLIANLYFVGPVNAAFGTSIEPFSDQEILEFAGIAP